jgi:hypothetical protein
MADPEMIAEVKGVYTGLMMVEKYSMPAEMWHNGIYGLPDRMRYKLLLSLCQMLIILFTQISSVVCQLSSTVANTMRNTARSGKARPSELS